MGSDLDLTGVAASDVAAVLNRAADLIDATGWAPTKADGRISALRAITVACDEIGGPGVDSAELHTASLDAVCLHVFGEQLHGRGASVSKWERQTAKAAVDAAIEAQGPAIATALRRAAA